MSTTTTQPKTIRFRFPGLPLLVAAAVSVSACQIQYRHEVEAPGTPAVYTTSAGDFMRYDGYDQVAGDFEIASRDYAKPGSKTKIRLVGVVHIGEIEYYRQLQKDALDTSDVVLFEGVKFEGQEEEAPDLGGLYDAMGNLLGLGFQKDGIDYKAKNFVHCDVTVGPGDPLFQQVDPAQLRQAKQLLGPLSMAKGLMAGGGDVKRVEDGLKHGMCSMMMLQMSGMDEEEAKKKLAEQFGADPSDPRRRQAERAYEQMKKLGPMMPGMPEGLMKEILDRRNQYVVEQLAARLEADGDAREQTIAIFYGAAHMPGIEKDLLAWGYKPVQTTWYRAWRMNSHEAPIVAERLKGSGAPAPAAAAEARPEPSRPERQPRARRDREPRLY